MGPSLDINRPRDVDWKRASALLYGDWGTSKAYVVGLAFAAASFSAFPIIIAVSILTAIVGINYIAVCKYFPDGGGVYSAAREQSRLLAAIGALLLIADFMITADVSGWAAASYFKVPTNLVPIATMSLIGLVGVVNFFGPKHSGSLSIWLAVPTVITVLAIIGVATPHLTLEYLEPPHTEPLKTWEQFTGVILALSGLEAVANLTGVMVLDRGCTVEKPIVLKTARRTVLLVATEVVVGTMILGWAMLSLPGVMGTGDETVRIMTEHKEDMLTLLGEKFGTQTFGPAFGHWFGIAVGIVFGLLLFSAVNTAIVAMIGVMFMLAQDGDMPRSFTKLNRYGVPIMPLLIATLLPIGVLFVSRDFEALAGLYAIGVVGAIAVNLGSCTFNRALPMRWWERGFMGGTFVILALVELTLARTKPDALFFVLCVLAVGLTLRAWSHKREGLETVTVSKQVADMVSDENLERITPRITEGARILVAARGVTPVLRYALEEARLRKATLCVLFVKEVAVFVGMQRRGDTPMKWKDDPEATAIMTLMLKLGEENGVDVIPVFAVSNDPAVTILDLSATLGADMLMLGSQHRFTLAKLLKGSVVEKVAHGLPETIQLVIYG